MLPRFQGALKWQGTHPAAIQLLLPLLLLLLLLV
jgi:hypothetical protein